MRRIKFIFVHTKRGLKLRSKQSLRIIYKNNKNKIFKNRKAYVMDIFNSFFFRRFSWTVYFFRHFSYPLRKASKICPAIPRQFSWYSSDGQVDSKILARYWTLSVHYNTLLCFPFTRDGRFLFQLFHLPMRFDCRKTSVLEREGGTYLRHKCNPVTFPWNRPYFVRKICISLICALSSTIRFLYFSSILTQMKSSAY